MPDRVMKAVKSPEGFFTVFFLVNELIFHITRYGITGGYLMNKLIFALILGLSLGLIVSALPKKVGKVVSIVLVCLFIIYFLTQLIYSSVFANYFSLSATGGVAGQALDYVSTIWGGILAEAIPFILYLVIIGASIFYIVKFSDFERRSATYYLVFAGFLATGMFYYIIILSYQGDGNNSPYSVFKKYTSVEMSIQKLGVLESMFRDGVYLFQDKSGGAVNYTDTGFEHEVYYESAPGAEEKVYVNNTTEDSLEEHQFEELSTAETTVVGQDVTEEASTEDTEESTEYIKTSYAQVLDINLSQMSDVTDSEAVLELNSYINASTPTYTNDYTGMFEGYNLIFITAEGFDGSVIDKSRTPELYKMANEGFVFKNFYTPLWYGSTLGGEYANMTGLMPKNGAYLSMEKIGYQKNAMPFTLGNALGREGYNVFAYHNNEYTYYDRDVSRPVLGYENYKGVGNGLPYENYQGGGLMWPQSDAFMEENTFKEYAGKEPFHVYYMTVSGHLEYNFGGNAMSAKNRDQVENLHYSDKTKAYIACQLEFELMLEELNADLEKAGIADKTLIVICGDHVPYNDMGILDELEGRPLETTFECYRNTLIIYSASMEEPVRVTKPCSSIDILPTVLNLMNVKYDSRMLAGRDIMSDTPGLVMMPDESFITEGYKYDAAADRVIANTGVTVSDAELENMKSTVSNRFRMAAAICELDYYKYVEDLMEDK